MNRTVVTVVVGGRRRNRSGSKQLWVSAARISLLYRNRRSPALDLVGIPTVLEHRTETGAAAEAAARLYGALGHSRSSRPSLASYLAFLDSSST